MVALSEEQEGCTFSPELTSYARMVRSRSVRELSIGDAVLKQAKQVMSKIRVRSTARSKIRVRSTARSKIRVRSGTRSKIRVRSGAGPMDTIGSRATSMMRVSMKE